MSISTDFETFCQNIQLDNFDEMHTSAGEIAKKLNKKYYSLDQDDSSHLYIVGSIGRCTAIKDSSDLDIIFDLPEEVFKKFDGYSSNGQSALLQEIKSVLKERYPKTDISGDGQVVVVSFTRYTVEIVPCFQQSDGRFKYPDTHDGGTWKYTDPFPEQKECANTNKTSNGIYYDFCHMVRAWKNNRGFKFGGLLIDTLIYDHFCDEDYYKNASIEEYLSITKNVLNYFSIQDKERVYWYAVGSNQHVYNSEEGAFVDQAREDLKKIEDVENDEDKLRSVLKEIFGKEFPEQLEHKNTNCIHGRRYRNTEEFIEQSCSVDIRYSLILDCKVTQNGFRDELLSRILRNRQILRRNKQLEFFIKSTDCPEPYDIYWKIRNVGAVAEERDCIRGQIRKTNSPKQREHTDFRGEHYAECYLIKNNVCVAKKRINVPIGNY